MDKASKSKFSLSDKFDRFLYRKIEPKLMPVFSWLFWKFFKDERGKDRFYMGIHEFLWTIMCGYGFRFSLKMANIWWKIGK